MVHINTLKLAAKILSSSRQNLLEWEDDPLYTGYSVILKSGKCRVWQDANEQIRFTVHNNSDQIVEEFAEFEVRNDFEFSADNLLELYSIAKRQALNVDTVIDDISKEIDDLEIPF